MKKFTFFLGFLFLIVCGKGNPIISIQSNYLDYGKIPLNSFSVDSLIIIKNIGTSELLIDSMSFNVGDNFHLSGYNRTKILPLCEDTLKISALSNKKGFFIDTLFIYNNHKLSKITLKSLIFSEILEKAKYNASLAIKNYSKRIDTFFNHYKNPNSVDPDVNMIEILYTIQFSNLNNSVNYLDNIKLLSYILQSEDDQDWYVYEFNNIPFDKRIDVSEKARNFCYSLYLKVTEYDLNNKLSEIKNYSKLENDEKIEYEQYCKKIKKATLFEIESKYLKELNNIRQNKN